MTKTQREIVGRSAIGVLGLALLLGGWKTLSTAIDITQDKRARAIRQSDSSTSPPRRTRTAGPGLFYLIGAVLILGGSIGVLAAVLPTSAMERLMGPPRYTTLGEHGEDDARRLLRRRY